MSTPLSQTEQTMPTEKLNTEKDSSGPPDPPNGHESRQSIAMLQDRSASTTGGTRSRLKFNKKRPDEAGKKKQLQDYTAWVNNYLKRKPGVPLITDIRVNLQDGISFVNLVEIVSRAEVEGVERYPTNADSRMNNIDRAVGFLKQDGVSLQGDAVRDILEGNSKGIMRVVLAIAERYQPRSVKPRSASDPKPYAVIQQQQTSFRDHVTPNRHTYTGHVTHDTNQHRDHVTVRTRSPDMPSQMRKSTLSANSFSVPNMNNLHIQPTGNGGHHRVSQTNSNPSTIHEAVNQPDRQSFQMPASLSQAEIDENAKDMYSMPIDHLPPTASTRIIAPIRKKGVQLRLRSGSTAIHSIPEDQLTDGGVSRRASLGGASIAISGSSLQVDSTGVHTEISDVLSGLNEFKTELLQLHAVLLRNTDGSDASLVKDSKEGGALKVGDTPTSSRDVPLEVNNTAMLAEKEHILAQKVVEMSTIRDQLAQLQDEYTQMESECSALRNMVEERDTFIKTMKTEIYRKEYKNDTAKVDLHNQLLQKDALIKKMEVELRSCQDSLESTQSNIEETNHRLEEHKSTELELKVEVDGLKMELARVTTTEDSLHSKLISRDRKIGHLEEKLMELQDARARKSEVVSEDADGIREYIVSLRRTLPPQDPQQQTIDGLERTISDLVSKLVERSASPTGKRSRRHAHRGDYEDHHRDKERRRRHKDKHNSHHEQKPEVGGAGLLTTPTSVSTLAASPVGGDVVKVFYYNMNDKTETPYVIQVPKRSEEVTLRDFKAVFDRPSSFRYYVKTEDPDCGVVKEEIKRDSTPLPNWKGRILIWVGEKSHHRN